MNRINPKLTIRFLTNLWQYCDKSESEYRLKQIFKREIQPKSLSERMFSIFASIYFELVNSKMMDNELFLGMCLHLGIKRISNDDECKVRELIQISNSEDANKIDFVNKSIVIFNLCFNIVSIKDYKIEIAKILINYYRIKSQMFPVVMYGLSCTTILDNLSNGEFVKMCLENLFDRSQSINNRNNAVLTLNFIKNTINENKDTLTIEYGIKSLYIFGSYARGEQTSFSDVDILVDFNERKYALNEISKFISEIIGIPCDVSNLENDHKTFYDVLREAILIF